MNVILHDTASKTKSIIYTCMTRGGVDTSFGMKLDFFDVDMNCVGSNATLMRVTSALAGMVVAFSVI